MYIYIRRRMLRIYKNVVGGTVGESGWFVVYAIRIYFVYIYLDNIIKVTPFNLFILLRWQSYNVDKLL